MAQILQNIRNDIWNVIGDESRLVGKLFAKIEQKTGKSRYQAAVMLAIVIFVLLIFSPNAGLLCNCICIGYPAMKTLIEVESNENANCKQWKFYWVIFGFFRLVDYFAECISFIIPIYWPLKCIFFVWLFTPSCHGAATLYEKFFQPRYSEFISGGTTAAEMTTE
ncbi:Receptor expression-enhancing protein 5 [Trichinella spiralis]|uniref:Receptor expression-enhancing protein n=1 Tax=Trichinella spiralis TaxID=6334 RepID=A0A0V1B4B5_TRISP|nr:Receptor expression-enhancing protein 5 [Trichinella spiralis]KRY31846.1 Receptor expression-enhancing protein 5 [Trichinella spiralis]KRY41306.1 Receptor expression-enhancing protein 5 [Trichinella spiralis]